MRIAVGREHLVDIALGGGMSLRMEISKVPPPEVVHGDMGRAAFMQAIRERRGRWLIDQAQNFLIRQVSPHLLWLGAAHH